MNKINVMLYGGFDKKTKNGRKAKVEIPITDNMTYKIEYNSQVNENTEFV